MKLAITALRFSLAVLIATASARRASAVEEPFHFQYDIAPQLARAGCAAAECHGGATGRGGFKLSLFATNPRADFEAITQDLGGRRVDYPQPELSLLLRKPARQLKHGGGRVIDLDDASYAALHRWIKEGAPFSRGDSGTLTALGLARDSQHLSVTATFTLPGGRSQERDVTGMARFESTDDRVAAVDEDGRIEIRGPGEAWLLARYGGLAARLPIINPLGQATPDLADRSAAENPLDRAWLGRLTELGLEPAGPAPPHQFLRRLYLDLTGRPPSPDEIRAFFELPENTRVEQTCANLIRGAEFTGQLARRLESWFEVPAAADDLKHTSERNRRLRSGLSEFAGSDRSLADFVSSIFLQPAERGLIQRFSDPRDRSEFAARALLGIKLNCARCHNHPLDRWSQAQHLQFSAFFTDQRPGRKTGNNSGEMTMLPGKFFLPGEGEAVPPALLPVRHTAPAPDELRGGDDRRSRLAQFFTVDAGDALARNAANRIFGMLLGIHLVEAPDDHRPSNPATHEPVLDLLAEKLSSSGYELRPLVQLIATSQLYASSSGPPEIDGPGTALQVQFLARREPRPMSGEQFQRALQAVLGIPLKSSEIPATPLTQQLHLLNSGVVRDALRTPGNQVDAIIDFETDPAQRLEQLYLLILSRPPREAERQAFLPLLSDQTDPRAAARDLAFALIASREFGSIR